MMTRPETKISFSGLISLLIVVSCIGVAFLHNGVYVLCCLVTLYIIVFSLWKRNRPGIIVFAFLMQWAQVAAYVIWMNVNNWNINQLSRHADLAVLTSCVGLVIMACIVAQGVKFLPIPTKAEFYSQAKLINEKKVFVLYLISTLFLGSIGFVLGNTSGFAQLILTMATFKWVFFLLYGYVAWINKKNRILLVVIILFEFFTALYSYFSSFKEVILISIIMALTFMGTINFRQVAYTIIVVLIVGFLLLTWTAIKGDYRNYLNQGKRKQVVEVSRSEAFNKIQDQVSNLTWDNYVFAIGMFLYRVQYVLHLAKTMDRVPEVLPFEYGQLWWANISYVLVPRILNPDKPIFEATKKTNKYTGMHYSGLKQGASFSLGYFADSYIDFGYLGMFIPLSFIALFIVMIYYRIFKFTKINILIRYALINVGLFDFTAFEADGLFLFGRLLLMFLVFWFLCKAVFPPLQRWLYK